ncbi:MAG: peptidoglycan editing factor PgeF [Prevotellaceae bacterium]|nr:peptidoglycan editing factor PgeF [Prevotellaceae bacterium]
MKKPVLTYYNIAPDVTAFSTTRHGGYGFGKYGEMNINTFCGDDEDTIKRNREALCTELGIETDRLIMPHQTHGTEIMQIADDFLSLPSPIQKMILEGIDALITDIKGICIGVSTADCIPIILYDTEHHATAVVHAGWRGTVKRIVCKAIYAMHLSYKSKPSNLIAVIGPGISLKAFEVGDEVYEQFASEGFDMNTISERKTKWHIDLKECNRQQIISSGILESNVSTLDICTYNNVEDYFSARRLGIDSGRIYTGIIIR